jgi:hypothetical protein
VLELVVNNSAIYYLISTDSEARRQWIAAIEAAMIAAGPDTGHGSNTRDSELLKTPESISTSIGIADMTYYPNPSGEKLAEAEAMFRLYVLKTQMMNSFFSKIESPDYDSVFKELGSFFWNLADNIPAFEKRMNKYLWRGGSVKSILDQLAGGNARAMEEECEGIPSPELPPNTGDLADLAGLSTPSNLVEHSKSKEKVTSVSEKGSERSSILGRFFSRSLSAPKASSTKVNTKQCNTLNKMKTNVFAQNGLLELAAEEIERETLAQIQRDKVTEQMLVNSLRSKANSAIATYRRSQCELHKMIAEVN